MTRSVPEWIGKTDDTPIPPRVKLRIWERDDGRCHITGKKINPGDKYQFDHKIAIINGGENRESNIAPALDAPHTEKTKSDVAEKSKIARLRQKHLGLWPKSVGNNRIQSREFQKART